MAEEAWGKQQGARSILHDSRRASALRSAIAIGILAIAAALPATPALASPSQPGPTTLLFESPFSPSSISAGKGLLPTVALPNKGEIATGLPASPEIEPFSKHPAETRPYALCPQPSKTRVSCLAVGTPNPEKLEELGEPIPNYEGSGKEGGFSPADLRSAYGLSEEEGGKGMTVAITIAYDDPEAFKDMNKYRKQYELPTLLECDEVKEGEPCFTKVNQDGEPVVQEEIVEGVFISNVEANAYWAQETSLDLDMVSSTCPECSILLVEADSNEFDDMGTAVEQAASMGADVISNSWGASGEWPEEVEYDPYFKQPGTPTFFASGDYGFGVEYPAASPDVVAVGGTALKKESEAPRGWTESAWRRAGSGCSQYEPKPAWQTDEATCPGRTLADVGAVADPATPVSVYDSFATPQEEYEKEKEGKELREWHNFGGTSVATPIVAGIEAQGSEYVHSLPGGDIYFSEPTVLHDVTTGANSVEGEPCLSPAEDPAPNEYLCHAGEGYDGPTGMGTPDGPMDSAGVLPVANTRTASEVSGSTATLHGSLNPQGLETTYHFEYGTSTSYGTSVPAAPAPAEPGTATQNVSKPLTGLASSTTYHYRLVATNSEGSTPGFDREFRTAEPNVSSLSTSTVDAIGGAQITITGSNFAGVSAVKFGANKAESFEVTSESSISAVAPAAIELGTVDITVTTPAGTSTTSSTDKLTYKASGTVRSWGTGYWGDLGNRGWGEAAAPVEVSDLSDVKELAAGILSSVALLNDGTVLSWGGASAGWHTLGNGTGWGSYTPTKVCAPEVTECPEGPYLEEVSQITSSGDTFALLDDGTVVGWGTNNVGELGSGSRVVCSSTGLRCSNVPVHVCTVVENPCQPSHYLQNVVEVSTAANHTIALLENGTVVAWGGAEEGELGQGNDTGPEKCELAPSVYHPCSIIAIPVQELQDVKAISAGAFYNLALLTNGTIRSWGWRGGGALGDGTDTDRYTPVSVCAIAETAPCSRKLEGVTEIAAGGLAGYALLRNGTVAAWGQASVGEFGDGVSRGDPSCYEQYCNPVPARVKHLSNVKKVAASDYEYNAVALLEDGRLFSWGAGANGAQGTGETIWGPNLPKQVCAAYAAGPCADGPYLSDEGEITNVAVGGFHGLVSFAARNPVTTRPANLIGSEGATLNGAVNPEGLDTSYWFEYGTSESYGQKAPTSPETLESDVKYTKVHDAISGLEPKTTYHFRLVTEDSEHTLSYGADKAFRTSDSRGPQFESDEYPVSVVGEHDNPDDPVFTMSDEAWQAVYCESTRFTGTISAASATLQLDPEYEGCSVRGGGGGGYSIEVDTNSCHYTFEVTHGPSPFGGALGVVCAKEGDEIDFEFAGCTIGIPPQTANGFLNYENDGHSHSRTINTLYSVEAEDIHYTKHDEGLCEVFLPGAGEEGASLVGGTSLAAFDEAEAQVGIQVSEEPTCEGTEGKCEWNLHSTPNPPLPSSPVNRSELGSISCPSTSVCLGTGYDINSGIAFEQRWDGTKWQADEYLSELSSDPQGIACPTTEECIAVGHQGTTATIEVWADYYGWAWLPVAEVSLPSISDASSTGLAEISCSSSSACTAVGSYSSKSNEGRKRTLVLRLSGGEWSWSATQQTSANPEGGEILSAWLQDVSCSSSSSCTAVGEAWEYYSLSWHLIPFAEQWNGSSWSLLSSIPTPSGSEYNYLEGLSCTSASACTVVGSSFYGVMNEGWEWPEFDQQPLAVRWNGTKWTTEEAPNPSEGNEWAELRDVKCTTASTCTAVGSYATEREETFPELFGEITKEKTLALAWNGSKWSTQSTPNPEGKDLPQLTGISCATSSSCAAVGFAWKAIWQAERTTLGESWNGSSWSIKSTPNPALPPDPLNYSQLGAVSCASEVSCLAIGHDGNSGKAFEQRWDGNEWQADEFLTQLEGNPQGIACLNAEECLTVGYQGSATIRVWAEVSGWGWLPVEEASVPAIEGATSSTLSDLSCSSEATCTAVGSYVKGGVRKTLALRLTRQEPWVWTATLQTTANPASGNAELRDVSCPSATFCTAVGTHGTEAIVETWSAGSWSIPTTPSVSGANATVLEGVSCSSANTCTAVGRYTDEVENEESEYFEYFGEAPEEIEQPFVLRWSGSSWSMQTMPEPNEGTKWNQLTDVNCISSSLCTAVGSYANQREELWGIHLSPTKEKTLSLAWDGSEWSVQSSPNPEGKSLSGLSSISCASQVSCASVGSAWTLVSGRWERTTLGEGYE